MPVVLIERVLSVSSEDPAFPAENLLKSGNNKKWKCKVGEKQPSVILQLKQETLIEGIDIGNEHSAFVEVLVAKSSSPSNDFKVLLVASSFMTLKESKDGTNTNSVRFFKKSDLTKSTVDEKWDRVKIVCSQPFNKHVQYGLSFLVLHSPNKQDDNGETSGVLGKFALKEKDEEPPVSVGSWFAKRKDPPPSVPPGAAAAIRDASSPVGIALGKNKKPTPKRPKNTTPKNGVLKPTKDVTPKGSPKLSTPKAPKPTPKLNMSLEEDSPADDTDADSTYSPNKDSASILSDDDVLPDESDEEDTRKQKKNNRRPIRDDAAGRATNVNIPNGKTPKRKNNDNGGNSRVKVAKARETKPFGRLLEGVAVVISGYQNPLRGELRSKACAMGARYKADWDPTCTHLICAFVNTPKFNQVRGRGKIVKKEWIEECHNRRRRVPWRRFALDRSDIGDSSEEEIWEEGSIPTSSHINTVIASGVNRRSVSSGSDTEEEIERVRARQAGTVAVTQTKNNDSPKKPKESGPFAGNTDDNESESGPFAGDTDVDSEPDSRIAKMPLPPLPDFFDNIVFHIAADIDDDDRRMLQRYITAYKGHVVEEVDCNVEYVLTKLPDIAAEIGEEFGISALSPDWVWECSDSEKLVPITGYLLE